MDTRHVLGFIDPALKHTSYCINDLYMNKIQDPVFCFEVNNSGRTRKIKVPFSASVHKI